MRKFSFVWKYFLKMENGKTKCHTCNKEVSNLGSSTSALRSHVLMHLNKEKKLLVFNMSNFKYMEELQEETKKLFDKEIHKDTKVKQQSNTIFNYIKPTLNECVARFAAADGFSFNQIISSSATIGYLRCLNYTCPLSKTTIRKMVLLYFNETSEILKNVFRNFKEKHHKFSVVLDEWICISSKRYLNVLVFCNESMYNIGLFKIVGSANANNIYSTTKYALNTFNIDFENDVISVTSDDASTMKSAFSSNAYFH